MAESELGIWENEWNCKFRDDKDFLKKNWPKLWTQLGRQAKEGLHISSSLFSACCNCSKTGLQKSEHASVGDTNKPPSPATPVNDLQTGHLSYLSVSSELETKQFC
jgi:hypothetical protein